MNEIVLFLKYGQKQLDVNLRIVFVIRYCDVDRAGCGVLTITPREALGVGHVTTKGGTSELT